MYSMLFNYTSIYTVHTPYNSNSFNYSTHNEHVLGANLVSLGAGYLREHTTSV